MTPVRRVLTVCAVAAALAASAGPAATADPAAAQCQKQYRATETVNVRNKPSTGADVFDVISRGESVCGQIVQGDDYQACGDKTWEWIEIDYGSRDGYAAAACFYGT
ncbi:hypothetical protein [Streptomyces sp. 6N223]|uniref:hypothetical protein n=1 Tax=Streptomyces sp. 6N223 TaxID=3457412 RepID=UPI003FD531C6